MNLVTGVLSKIGEGVVYCSDKVVAAGNWGLKTINERVQSLTHYVLGRSTDYVRKEFDRNCEQLQEKVTKPSIDAVFDRITELTAPILSQGQGCLQSITNLTTMTQGSLIPLLRNSNIMMVGLRHLGPALKGTLFVTATTLELYTFTHLKDVNGQINYLSCLLFTLGIPTTTYLGRNFLASYLATNQDVEARNEQGSTRLHRECIKGDIATILSLLDNGADPRTRDCEGKTPLHNACLLGHAEVARILIERKADINLVDTSGCTPLEASLTSPRSLSLAGFLISYGALPEFTERGNETLLHEACAEGVFALVKALLDKGYNPEKRDSEGRTALHHACIGSHVKVVELLLNPPQYSSWEPADVNATCNAGRSALHEASSLDVAELLLDSGANPSVADKKHKTPLHECSSPELASLFITRGGDLSALDNEGRTPLLAAVAGGHLELVKAIVPKENFIRIHRHKVDWEGFGRRAFHIACMKGHDDIVEFFIEHIPHRGMPELHRAILDSDVSVIEGLLKYEEQISKMYHRVRTYYRDSIPNIKFLHLACILGRADVVELFMRLKRKDWSKGDSGKMPLDLACASGNLECAKLLLKNGHPINPTMSKGGIGKFTPLTIAARGSSNSRNDQSLMPWEIKRYIEAKSMQGQFFFFSATESDRLELVRFLVEIAMNIEGGKASCSSALSNAAAAGEVSIVKFLLERGASPIPRTVLHMVANGETAKVLIDAGADMEAEIERPTGDSALCRINEVMTPLKSAIDLQRSNDKYDAKYEIIRVLISAGATIEPSNGIYKRSPLWYAIKREEVGIVKLLLESGVSVNYDKVERDCRSPYYAGRPCELNPLDHAYFIGSKEIVKVLLDCGARISDFTKKCATFAFQRDATFREVNALIIRALANQ